MSRIITVFGATGAQGGSVVASILSNSELSKTYAIRAITRDPTKASAQALQAKGVETVKADMDHVESLRKAVRGSYAVFAVTDFWATASKATEVSQGKNITDACVAEKVHHLIYSSLPNVTELTKGALKKVSHFDGKAEIEDYIRGTDLVSTFFMPAFYMSNIKSMSFGDPKVFAQPWDAEKTRVPLLDTRKDTGKYVAGILLAPEQEVNGLRVQGVSQWLSPKEIVQTITDVTGKQYKFVPTTQEQTTAALTQAMGSAEVGEELAENMVLVRDFSYYGVGSENETAKSQALLHERPVTWREYVESEQGW